MSFLSRANTGVTNFQFCVLCSQYLIFLSVYDSVSTVNSCPSGYFDLCMFKKYCLLLGAIVCLTSLFVLYWYMYLEELYICYPDTEC